MTNAFKPGSHPRDRGWTLRDAKAHFHELIRRARTEGPQRVTVRGHDDVLVIAADPSKRVPPPATEAVPFVTFMESLSVDGLDLNRDQDVGRDIALRSAGCWIPTLPPNSSARVAPYG